MTYISLVDAQEGIKSIHKYSDKELAEICKDHNKFNALISKVNRDLEKIKEERKEIYNRFPELRDSIETTDTKKKESEKDGDAKWTGD